MKTVLALSAALACALPLYAHRISGTVVNALTGSVMDRVRVSIAPTSDRTRITYATTGSNGRFVFDNLPAGKWSLGAERRGYLPHRFGQPPFVGAFGVAILTGPGESTENLVFRLYPPAMITGKVTDISGDPVENAYVQVLSSMNVAGRREMRTIRSGWTNDDGVYAIGLLPAGAYFIAVTGQPWYSNVAGDQARAFPPHFYPGGTDANLAAPIVVHWGDEATADLALTPAPAVRLTLRTSGAPVRLRLSSEGIKGAPVWQRGSNSTSRVHSFVLAPGRYTAWYAPRDESSAVQTIDLPAQDTSLELAPDHPANISAVVELQGVSMRPAAASDPASIGLALTSEGGLRNVPRMIRPGVPVEFPPQPAGRYALRLIGPGARNSFIDRVSAEGARFAKGVLEIGAGAAVRLRVWVAGQGGRVEGKVFREDQPVAGALVVLAPRIDTGNPADYRAFFSDSDGSFEYPLVKSGEYVAFVVEDGSQLEFANPMAIAPYMKSGRQVQVEPGGALNLRLELPAPERTEKPLK